MEYMLFIILSSLFIGFIIYVVRQLIKRANRKNVIERECPVTLDDDTEDDFMCIMRSDGSTIAISKGVVVTGRKIK